MALLPVIYCSAWRRRLPATIGEFGAVCAVALLGNAFVCGALANPHDRYGARMVWLAALAVMVALGPPGTRPAWAAAQGRLDCGARTSTPPRILIGDHERWPMPP